MDLTKLYTHPDQWMKNAFSNSTRTAHCLMGSLLNPNGLGLVGTIAKAIHQLFPERSSCGVYPGCVEVARFNDHPDTTFEDVQKVLQQAEYLKTLPEGAI